MLDIILTLDNLIKCTVNELSHTYTKFTYFLLQVREAVLDVLGNFHLLEMPMTQMQLYQAGIISHLIDIINTSLDETENHASERIASEVFNTLITFVLPRP